jgi:predicted peroxiredoxin
MPSFLAKAALASNVDVIMGFQVNGVLLMKKGLAEHVLASGYPSLIELIVAYQEVGGKHFVCGPCVNSRK